MLKWLLALVLPFTGFARQMPLVGASGQDECAVRGVVINAAGGEPLHKAAVSLCRADDFTNCTGSETDATGNFEIRGIYAGRYMLSALRTGYVRQQYGQRKPNGLGEVLELSRGQQLSGLSIALPPAAVIYGNVYDEYGAPVANAVVAELHVDYLQGQRQLSIGSTTLTNDLGEYRLWGLNPGMHFMLADYRLQRLANIRVETGYLPTFYPNVLDAAHASPIVVQAGDQYSGANIDLQPSRVFSVRGKVYPLGADAKVFLILRDITAFGDLVPPVYAPVRNGSFEISNVTPGAYFLYAFGGDPSNPVVSREPVEVTDSDLDRVNIILQPAVKLGGIISMEGMPPGSSMPSFQITLVPREGRAGLITAPSTLSKPSGGFSFTGVYPGDYDLKIENLYGDTYLKSARIGGYDVLEHGFSPDFSPGYGRLEIVIGRDGGTVEGTVTKAQQLDAGATVVLVPNYRQQTCLYKLTATDHSGRFLIKGVPPGRYKVFAWESIEHAAYTSNQFLQPFELRGQSVYVSEGSQVTANVAVIPDTEQGR